MDISELSSELGSTLLASLAMVLVVIIVVIIFKRVSGKTSNSLGKPGGLDLLDLKKRGLLSPDEISRVGEAMARQMQREDSKEKRKSSFESADQLLLDPEVRRLQAMADAAKTADDKARQNQKPARAAQPPIEESLKVAGDKTSFSSDLDDVELPMDIQQLADSGLLSEEEIANVKKRILERRLGGSGQG